MKFIYIDESGNTSDDFFIMAGIMIDGVKLNKYTQKLNQIFKSFSESHSEILGNHRFKELKTSKLINGRGIFSSIHHNDRKSLIDTLINVIEDSQSNILMFPLDFNKFRRIENIPNIRESNSYHIMSSMFLVSLIQKLNHQHKNNKGLTVTVFDRCDKFSNKISEIIHRRDKNFDNLYKTKKNKDKKTDEIKEDLRFDQIINNAFHIDSKQSSFIQLADCICYIYRRHLEIQSGSSQSFSGEKDLYESWIERLETRKEKMKLSSNNSEISIFYKNISCNLIKI